MLVGFYHIWKRPKQPPQNEQMARDVQAAMELLNDLVLKAIELSEAERRLRRKDFPNAFN